MQISCVYLIKSTKIYGVAGKTQFSHDRVIVIQGLCLLIINSNCPSLWDHELQGAFIYKEKRGDLGYRCVTLVTVGDLAKMVTCSSLN